MTVPESMNEYFTRGEPEAEEAPSERIAIFSKRNSIGTVRRKIGSQIFPRSTESFIVFRRPRKFLLARNVARACTAPDVRNKEKLQLQTKLLRDRRPGGSRMRGAGWRRGCSSEIPRDYIGMIRLPTERDLWLRRGAEGEGNVLKTSTVSSGWRSLPPQRLHRTGREALVRVVSRLSAFHQRRSTGWGVINACLTRVISSGHAWNYEWMAPPKSPLLPSNPSFFLCRSSTPLTSEDAGEEFTLVRRVISRLLLSRSHPRAALESKGHPVVGFSSGQFH